MPKYTTSIQVITHIDVESICDGNDIDDTVNRVESDIENIIQSALSHYGEADVRCESFTEEEEND